MSRNIPQIAYSILRFLLHKKERDYLLPIYENIFYDLQGTKGLVAAPSILGNEFYWNVVMVKNYFTTSKIYNIQGKKFVILVDCQMNVGYKSIEWNAKNMASGTYFYRLTVSAKTLTKKMTLIK